MLILLYVLINFSFTDISLPLKDITDVEDTLIENPWRSTKYNITGVIPNSELSFVFYKEEVSPGRVRRSFEARLRQTNKKIFGTWQILQKAPEDFRLILKYDLKVSRLDSSLEFSIKNPFTPQEMNMVLIPVDSIKRSKMKLTRI